jgi:tetratricopeptide (TPR) repeat protein
VLFGEVELALLGKRRPQTPEEQTRLDQAIAAFKKSVELRPGYGEGWALLGYSYNLEAKPSPDAVSTLEKAYEKLPSRGDVAYNLLLGYARAGKRQEAIDLVATAEARGATEEQLAPARQTLLQLDFQYAVALAREKKLDEAATLLEKVVAESSDAGLSKQAADFLKQIRP